MALLLAGAACLLYARTRRKMLWSETAGRRRLDQHPSGAPMQLQAQFMLSPCSDHNPLWHSGCLSIRVGCGWAISVAVTCVLDACIVSDMGALCRFG